jgi:archaellum component FlaC
MRLDELRDRMEPREVTIKQVADECGVSKSTAVRKLKELDLPVITRGGKGTVYLGPEAASALAHALMKSRAPEVSSEEASEIIGIASVDDAEVDTLMSEIVANQPEIPAAAMPSEISALIEAYRDQIRTLKETNATLRSQVAQLSQTSDGIRSNYEATITVLTSQVERLNEQIVALQREKDLMRRDLAMSRALEGFHFPWQRDQIMAQYLLPPSHMGGNGDDPTYEMPQQ